MAGRRRSRAPGAEPNRSRATAQPNRGGVHFLRSDIAAQVVAQTRVGPGDLVFDLGAGLGALTGPLARTGARVFAIERDAGFAARLRDRFADEPAVTIVCADLRTVRLPRRDFRVVANIPFATTAAVCRRLLDPPGGALTAADLVVQDEAAKRIAASVSGAAGAWWSARFAIRRGRRLEPSCFTPPPAVAAAILTVRRVPLSVAAESTLTALLRRARREPACRLRQAVAGRLGPRQLRGLGADPDQPIGAIAGPVWRAVACTLAERDGQ